MSSIGNKIVMSKNLRRLLAERGIDRKKICEDLGFAYTTFTDWYNGAKYPRIDKIEMMANYFGVPKSALIEEQPELPSNMHPVRWREPVPLIGDIACGTPILAEQNITDYVQTPEHVYCDFALKCHGDSMINAGIRDGDIVYIRQQCVVDNGQIAAVLVGDEEATLKRFYRVGDTVTLNAENPAFPPLVFVGEEVSQVHIIGLAIAYTHVID